ncbi:protodermal factor 1-like [Phragmites australis]|uniref:protodermal factor 1-like n=1 Tax=Phragmites australis TaxID=29695 RepID=UPI002D76F9A8|nr:protodermal factor 1-like [Phragmites australis]
MEAKKTARAVLASFVLAALAAQALVAVVESRSNPMEKASQGDVKKPDCVPAMDPRTFPGIGGGHGGITPVPSHGGSSGTTPSHGGSSGTSPSHGGGYGTPSHGGSGALPSPSHGGYGTTPAAPSTGGVSPSPSHGGAYGSSPSPPNGGAYGSSPTPSHGAYGGTPPAYGDSPATPSHGGFGTSTPTPFIPVDPHSPGVLPGTCDYWRSHPMEIWSAIGGRWPSSMGHFFGTAGSAAAGGTDVSIQDALANTRTDGAGALLREGAAALLNSMTLAGFPYTTEQVRDAFAAAAAGGSDGAAAAQAAAFKKANEGRA